MGTEDDYLTPAERRIHESINKLKYKNKLLMEENYELHKTLINIRKDMNELKSKMKYLSNLSWWDRLKQQFIIWKWRR